MARSKSISFALAVLLVLAGLAIWTVTRPMRILRSQRSKALREMAMVAVALEVFFVKDTGHYASPQEFARGVEYNYWSPQVTVLGVTTQWESLVSARNVVAVSRLDQSPDHSLQLPGRPWRRRGVNGSQALRQYFARHMRIILSACGPRRAARS